MKSVALSVQKKRKRLEGGKDPHDFCDFAWPNCTISDQLRSALGRPTIWLSLALTAIFFEGAFRKWVPGFDSGLAHIFAYLSKDFLFGFGVLMVCSRQSGSSGSPRPSFIQLGLWALALILFGGLVSVLAGLNPAGSILSLRALVVLPLFSFIYTTRVRGFPLVGFAAICVMLACINAPLSLFQSGLPASHVLNVYARDERSVVEVASGVRATGTFAYLTGLGTAAVLGVWGGLVLLSLGNNRSLKITGCLGVFSGFACAFASGSRSDLVILLTIILLWGILSIQATRILWKSLWAISVVFLSINLTIPALGERFLTMGQGVIDRFETAGDSNTQRAFGQFDELWYAVSHHPLGTGLGTEQVGGNFLSKGASNFTQYENQFPRIVAEFGAIGFVGFLLLGLTSFLALQATRGKANSWRWNLVVTATQIFLISQFYRNLVFNHTASAAVWLVVTAVLAAAPALTAGGNTKSKS
jgi:hypothetical protein